MDTCSITEKYTTVLLFVFYFIFRNIGKNKLPYLLYALLASSLIQCLYAQLQLWGIFNSRHAMFNITGSFFNPAPYAGFLSVVLPIAILLYLSRHHISCPFFKKWRIGNIAFITMLFILILLPSTKSRAAWFASFIATSVILWCTFWKHKQKNIFRQYRFLFFTMILIVMIIGAFGMYHLKKDSANGRLFIWRVSTQMIRENLLFGSGVDSFQQRYMLYQAYFFKLHPEHSTMELSDNVSYVYDEPYKVLIELGIIGLILVVCIAICAFLSFGETNISYRIAQAALLSLFVFGLFSYPSAILPLRVCTVLFISIIACYSLPVKTVNINHTMTYSCVLLFGFLVCVPFAMKTIKIYHNALQEWRQGVILYNNKQYLQSSKCFDASFSTLQTDGNFLIQYGIILSLSDRYDYAAAVLNQATKYQNNTMLYTTLGDCYKKLYQYQKAEDAYYMAYNMVPSRIFPLYLLAKLYHETGQSAKFNEMADKVLMKQPKVQSKAVDEMKIEIQQLKNDI